MKQRRGFSHFKGIRFYSESEMYAKHLCQLWRNKHGIHFPFMQKPYCNRLILIVANKLKRIERFKGHYQSRKTVSLFSFTLFFPRNHLLLQFRPSSSRMTMTTCESVASKNTTVHFGIHFSHLLNTHSHRGSNFNNIKENSERVKSSEMHSWSEKRTVLALFTNH